MQLATERVLPETIEREPAVVLGRDRYERHVSIWGYRNGYEDGILRTAEGVLRIKVPRVCGLEEPYHWQVWAHMAKASDWLKTLSVEMFVGGMSQRDIEAALEKALGQCVLSKNAINTLTDTLRQEYEAFRTRDLSGSDVMYLFIGMVYEPLRR